MSSLEKLLVEGIRSFDPENHVIMTFGQPLTLILGNNGTGKSTIIECLKLMSTGELPPMARQGQSFIHDPRTREYEMETNARIALQFRTAAGQVVICRRSFRLRRRGSKMEFRTIEKNIQIYNDIGGKITRWDMDQEIPNIMGFSKSVLDNVIFVHQDDATWPLEDPATMKKKLGDILVKPRYKLPLEALRKAREGSLQDVKEDRKRLKKLQTLKDAACQLQESITGDEEELKSLKRKMKDLKKKLADEDGKVKDIAERTKCELQKLEDQKLVETAEGQKNLDSEIHKANKIVKRRKKKQRKLGDLSSLIEERETVSEERKKLNPISELSKCRGARSAYKVNISKNKKELNEEKYKDIDKLLFDQKLKIESTEMAISDIDSGYNSLDKAIKSLESTMLEGLNDIIRQLWQKIYRGNDIDYIRIISNSDDAANHSNSYKVVMLIGAHELEMRGRCSEGQKVLASLVIRLALAEKFCINGGIMALDEPTVNLDEQHVESLAAALKGIIESRTEQTNFQLIVITQDERFAHLVGDGCRFYRITKNDLGHSIIGVDNLAPEQHQMGVCD